MTKNNYEKIRNKLLKYEKVSLDEVNVNDVIKKDIISFIGQVDNDKPDFKNLRLPNNYSNYIQVLAFLKQLSYF